MSCGSREGGRSKHAAGLTPAAVAVCWELVGLVPHLLLGVLGHKAVVVDGVDVALLTDQEPEAAAGGIFKADAPGLLAQDPLDVIPEQPAQHERCVVTPCAYWDWFWHAPVVQLVVEAFWDLDHLGWVPVLNDNEVVWLEKGPPLLQKVQVADSWDDNVQLVC